MFERRVLGVALVLAAVSVAVQAAAQKPAPAKVPPSSAAVPYVPAIMARMVTLAGCLRHEQDYILTEAVVAGQGEKAPAQPAPAATYKIEGLSAARLSLLVGKRVEVSGGYQEAAKGGAAGALARFEAANVTEVEGATCPSK